MIKEYIHKSLATGGWFELSLAEQLGNIGSEYYRAIKARQMNDENRYNSAVDRALELCELTVADKRWYNTPTLQEMCRMKSQVAETLVDDNNPDEGLQKYFDGFAYLARKDK